MDPFLVQQHQDLDAQLTAAKRHVETLEATREMLEGQNERNLREIGDLAREREDLVSDLTAVNKKLAATTADKQDLGVQLAAAQREVQRLTAKARELQADLEQETRARVDVESELEGTQAELQRTAADLAVTKVRGLLHGRSFSMLAGRCPFRSSALTKSYHINHQEPFRNLPSPLDLRKRPRTWTMPWRTLWPASAPSIPRPRTSPTSWAAPRARSRC